MKNLLISIIYSAARRYFGRQFFDSVEKFVYLMMSEDLSGDEKREKVRAFVKEQWGDMRNAVIDTIIQIVLLSRGDLK